jgi:NAD(P)-dependent dehydrogenase (short-subunit alcohol dehydrogenase family)
MIDEDAVWSGSQHLSLGGQYAVVTGGSKGIGLGIANALLRAGASVVIVGRNSEDLDKAVCDLQASSPTTAQTVHGVRGDVSRPGDIARLFSDLRGLVPHLNIFVANAGTGSYIPFLDIEPQEWDDLVAINLSGTFHCCQAAAKMMLDRPADNRAILIVSSIRADGARPGLAVYASTKAAINQLAKIAAYELAPHNIRVNILSPGMTVTPLVLTNTPGVFDKARDLVPMQRPGTPEDMAGAALYLCSPSAQFVTGANLVVDGGESLW